MRYEDRTTSATEQSLNHWDYNAGYATALAGARGEHEDGGGGLHDVNADAGVLDAHLKNGKPSRQQDRKCA